MLRQARCPTHPPGIGGRPRKGTPTSALTASGESQGMGDRSNTRRARCPSSLEDARAASLRPHVGRPRSAGA
jgi:hypothetical protein